MQQVTAIRQAISIPRLFSDHERDLTKQVMAAWAKKQGKPVVFEEGPTYIALVDGKRYRFQCQRRAEINGYGFERSALLAQNLDGVLLFCQSEVRDNKYLWCLYTPEDIAGDCTSGRRTIVPAFDEDSEDYILL